MAADGEAAALAAPAAASGSSEGGQRVEELADELQQCVSDARALVERERDSAFLEFEAARVQLHTEFSQHFLEIDRELQRLQDENALLHESCDAVEARQNDVVMLNVGGQHYTVKRETLCICPGSFMAELFSGRWDRSLQRDSRGSVFLDIDPTVFELLLGWLRDKKIETPERPAPPPAVAREDLTHFQVVVDFLGLRPFLNMPDLRPDGWASANRPEPAKPSTTKAPVSAPSRGSQSSLLEAAGSFLASFRSSSGASAGSSGSGGNGGTATTAVAAVAKADAGASRSIGWSQRFSHPAARRGDSAIAQVAISDTHAQDSAAAVRATRGFQSGVHYWEVQVLVLSDCSYVGLVSATWADVHTPVGCALESWGVASDGAVFVHGEERMRLPYGFGEGSAVGFLLELGGEGQRTATVFLDGKRHNDLFCNLPETVYPAASNNRAPAQYTISCDGAALPQAADPAGDEPQ